MQNSSYWLYISNLAGSFSIFLLIIIINNNNAHLYCTMYVKNDTPVTTKTNSAYNHNKQMHGCYNSLNKWELWFVLNVEHVSVCLSWDGRPNVWYKCAFLCELTHSFTVKPGCTTEAFRLQGQTSTVGECAIWARGRIECLPLTVVPFWTNGLVWTGGVFITVETR